MGLALLVCVLASGAGDAEVARSAPIVTEIGGTTLQLSGTFELARRAGEFPAVRGHFRAVTVASIPESDTEHGDSRLSVAFDAADGIPAPVVTGCPDGFSGTCRSVFTNRRAGARPDRIMFDTSNAAELAPLLGADPLELIPRVLSGRLGGVDRSTAAVVGQGSAVAAVRPTIAYVGARDGMLHAVCADAVPPCPRAGVELWAFLPRTQLPLLWRNAQGIDGSPRVDDVFGDFGTFDQDTGRLVSATRDGLNEFRTVLVFQSTSAAAAYALDVTQPASPVVLWERETPGDGVSLAMGPTRVSSRPAYLVFAQTNLRQDPGKSGFAVTAIDAVTGDVAWAFEHQYADHRDTGAALPERDAIPGGVAAIATSGQFALDKVVVPTLSGELFVLAAGSGDNVGHRDPTRPLFRFRDDGMPIAAAPAIYADGQGQFHALVVSGGYQHGAGGSVGGGSHMVVSVPLGVEPVTATLDETSAAIDFSHDLSGDAGAGHAGFAQPTIAGNEAFVVSDRENVNASGYGAGPGSGSLLRYDLATGEIKGAAVAIAGGASSIDVSKRTHKAYIGTKGSLRSASLVEPAFDPNGDSVERAGFSRTFRRLWLRVQ